MFTHVMVGANDLEKSKKFYDALMGVLGYREGVNDDTPIRRRYVYRSDGGAFYVSQPLDGMEATHANGGTVGFRCASADQVDLWHAAGVANGGSSAEAPPGLRTFAKGSVYLAYLRDPDGNKLCAVYQAPA